MRIAVLSLIDFRNYTKCHIQFNESLNILYGENGAGKTNILEAIYYLAITKSFRTSVDRHLIRNQKEMFRIQGDLISDSNQTLTVSVAYSLTQGKILQVNHQRINRFSDYIGEIPVVLLVPQDLTLTQGGPSERRRFLDILLSQSSRIYLQQLIEYRRSLKQRNALLLSEKVDVAVMESWENKLAEHGSEIILRRRKALEWLNVRVNEIYHALSNKDDRIKLIYRSQIQGENTEDLQKNFLHWFQKNRNRERELGSTLAGPHRDDVLILISGKPARVYASQGEHKTLVIALKLAEFQYLQHQRNETPILLFDDIFGELDARRIQHMLDQLRKMGQVFITTTTRNFFEKLPETEANSHFYHVKQGTIEPELS